jgi:hypothetical protein
MVGAHCNEIYIATDRRWRTVSQLNNRLRKQRNRVCQSCGQTFQTKTCETARAVPSRAEPGNTQYRCLWPEADVPSTLSTAVGDLTQFWWRHKFIISSPFLHRFELGLSQYFPSDLWTYPYVIELGWLFVRELYAGLKMLKKELTASLLFGKCDELK